eukprot:3298381-Rhodomonas_salina.1
MVKGRGVVTDKRSRENERRRKGLTERGGEGEGERERGRAGVRKGHTLPLTHMERTKAREGGREGGREGEREAGEGERQGERERCAQWT